MVSSLKVQNGAMIGTLAGKSVVCFVRAKQGSEPPAGKYFVRGPLDDPVYGRVAILTSASGTGAGQPISTWYTQPPPGATAFNCFMPSGAAVSDDWEATGPLSMYDWIRTPAAGGGALVLSGRVIPGANCLVVTSGLTELMDALKLAGSAEITFV